MPLWLRALDGATTALFGMPIASRMHDGALLVPLTAKFAFISPSLLVIVMPLLSLLPIALVVATSRRPVRRTPVWYGGLSPDRTRASTTALTFSNAMRTFYSFVYRPTAATERDADAGGYFVTKLSFEHDVAPIFGPLLFQPAVIVVQALAARLRVPAVGRAQLLSQSDWIAPRVGPRTDVVLKTKEDRRDMDVWGDSVLWRAGLLGAVCTVDPGAAGIRPGLSLCDDDHQRHGKLPHGVSLRRNARAPHAGAVDSHWGADRIPSAATQRFRRSRWRRCCSPKAGSWRRPRSMSLFQSGLVRPPHLEEPISREISEGRKLMNTDILIVRAICMRPIRASASA